MKIMACCKEILKERKRSVSGKDFSVCFLQIIFLLGFLYHAICILAHWRR